MYDTNLIFWINWEINDMIDIDKTKMRDAEQYFRLHDSKRQKIMRDYDFSQISIPKQYLELTETQKESIKEYVQVFCLESSDYERYLSLICHVGSCFEKADLNETPEYSAISANYNYLKELWNQRYPLEYQQFELEKQRGCIEANNQPQTTKPNCIECGSNDVISREPNWYCKSCGRQWLKHPRTKNLKLKR